METKNTHSEHDLLEFHKAMTALEEQYKQKICKERKKSDKLERQLDDSKAESTSIQEASQAHPRRCDSNPKKCDRHPRRCTKERLPRRCMREQPEEVHEIDNPRRCTR